MDIIIEEVTVVRKFNKELEGKIVEVEDRGFVILYKVERVAESRLTVSESTGDQSYLYLQDVESGKWKLTPTNWTLPVQNKPQRKPKEPGDKRPNLDIREAGALTVKILKESGVKMRKYDLYQEFEKRGGQSPYATFPTTEAKYTDGIESPKKGWYQYKDKGIKVNGTKRVSAISQENDELGASEQLAAF